MVWDEAVAAHMVASGLRCSSATRVATGLPGATPKPGAEPLVDLVAKTQRDLALRVSPALHCRCRCCMPVLADTLVHTPTNHQELCGQSRACMLG